MTGPDDVVPDKVLEELSAAFAATTEEPATVPSYDFDDPSIDRMLGLDSGPPPANSPTAPGPAEPAHDEPERAELEETGPEPAEPEPAGPAEPGPDGQAAGLVPTAAPRRVIVIADDHQHVDAVFLDEHAEQRLREVHPPSNDHSGASPDDSGGRSTIVIGEYDERTDAMPAKAAAGSIDPRLRARRIAVRRAAGRRRLLWGGLIAAVVIVVVGVVALLASTLFDVTKIDTQGVVYTDKAVVDQVVASLRGKAILLVDTRAAERALEASPWVDTARVATDFPHHVLIDVRERVPEATFAGSDGKFRVIDRDGRVLAVVDGRPVAYMLLTGTAPDTEPGQFAGTPYASAAQLVIALPPEIRSIASSVGVDAATGGMTIALDAPQAAGVQVNLGTADSMQDKLARLLKFVRDGLKPGQRLDVSTVEVGT
ncbi:MAG: FtsQ-type POTRA domain-containing protein [Ilumatobacteraceae bacterium]